MDYIEGRITDIMSANELEAQIKILDATKLNITAIKDEGNYISITIGNTTYKLQKYVAPSE